MSRPFQTIADLLKRVEKTDTCWLWLGEINMKGYGAVKWQGRNAKAHRVFYQHYKGPIPDGLQIDHLCRVRNCVNPDHLELVTRRENILRGTGPAAINAKRTHCIRGHALFGENVYRNKHGHRDCRKCRIIREAGYRMKAPQPHANESLSSDSFDLSAADREQLSRGAAS